VDHIGQKHDVALIDVVRKHEPGSRKRLGQSLDTFDRVTGGTTPTET
jgi:hypothetical protein